jgi:hypothetical protein
MSEPKLDPKLANAEAKAAKAKAKSLRPWFKKKRFIAPLALVVIIGLSTAANGGNIAAPTGSQTNGSESSETKQEETTSETVSQKNAKAKAELYLSTQAFSRTGLIKQLQFEDFEKADAEYAVDALKVDWKEQAAKKAEQYLDTQSFSKKGLIDQLKFEGFTKDEAEYGVSTTGL